MCDALRLDPRAFNLDLPFPLEDWALSEDLSLIRSGLFFADMRRQFYEALLMDQPGLKNSAAWLTHAESEFWNHEFNRIIAKRRDGAIIGDGRVKH